MDTVIEVPRQTTEEAVRDDLTRSGRKKIPALTGIRGYAACWVLIFHAGFLGAAHNNGSALDNIPVIRNGYLGVDLFFLLSGYVLFLTYVRILLPLNRGAIRIFGIGRAFRILPLHWFVLGCFFLCSPFLGTYSPVGSAGGLPAFFAVVALVQTLLHLPSSWNPPSWSLSAEWIAYLGFPLLTILVARTRDWRWCVAAIAIAFALLWVLCALSDHPGLNHAQRLGLARCLIEFPAGMLLCRIAQLRPIGPRAIKGMLAAGTVLLGFALVDPTIDPLALPAFSLFILAAGTNAALPHRLFGNRVAHFLGEISFSIYLLHVLVLQLALVQVAPADGRTGLLMTLGGAVGVTIVLSWVLWRLIEVPAQARGRLVARRFADR